MSLLVARVTCSKSSGERPVVGQALVTYRTNLSPFTKGFRGTGAQTVPETSFCELSLVEQLICKLFGDMKQMDTHHLPIFLPGLPTHRHLLSTSTVMAGDSVTTCALPCRSWSYFLE